MVLYSSFKDNIWGANLADMQLITTFNKGIKFLLCVFGKYISLVNMNDSWVVPLRIKKGVTIVNNFQKVLNKSDHRPNKIWIDKRSEFYNNSFKKWLKNNDIKMFST